SDLSMAFGNPYGDPWDEDKVCEAIEKIVDFEIRSISLADTVGVASHDLIGRGVGSVTGEYGDYDIGVHLHSTREDASPKVLAAYAAGCPPFAGASAGPGGGCF